MGKNVCLLTVPISIEEAKRINKVSGWMLLTDAEKRESRE